MRNDSSEEQQLIAELSQQIVGQMAPEEMDLFDELMQDYFANPKPPDMSADQSDDPLGFGIGELMVAVTPAAAAVASAAVAFFATVVLKATQDEAVAQIRARLKQFFAAKKQEPSTESPLAPAQLEELRKILQTTATRYGMDAEQAEAMTNATLVTLMLGPDAGTGSRRLMRILFLAANPGGTNQLRLDEEIRSIDDALRQSQFRNRFQIEQHWAVRVSDLQELLLRHEPDIVHFSGHGSQSSSIIVEDIVGQPTEIPSGALSDLFSVLKGHIRCVVLNACYSEAQASALAEHVDCVVGMSRAVSDQVAISFAASFYQALGYGKDVQTAFELGVNQARLNGLPDPDVPQLLSKHHSARDTRFA